MKAIILAAGQGKRMRTPLQKVMHPLLGQPMIYYPVAACRAAGITDITVVVSPGGGEAVRQALPDVQFAVQAQPLGTGHAVQAAAGQVHDNDDVLILAGDMPLLTAEFIQGLTAHYCQNACQAVMAVCYKDDPADLGRVYADEQDRFIENVEARDMTSAHAPTHWVNTGAYIFKGVALKEGLSRLKNENSQHEYYLTDVPKILRTRGHNVRVYRCPQASHIFTGINTQVQLAEAVGYMRARINQRHMLNGVRMIDPATVYIDEATQIAPQAVIYPGVVLEGACKIDEGAKILPYSVLNIAQVGAYTDVGPFAYLRPGSVIGEHCRIGNFVEVKNATIGDGSKAAHLAYIGDATVGKHVNYSCGVITGNYDGKNKNRTTIGDNAFIGCNTNLIAPVDIGEWAFVAAGSTIDESVPPHALGIARAPEKIKLNWEKDPRKQGAK